MVRSSMVAVAVVVLGSFACSGVAEPPPAPPIEAPSVAPGAVAPDAAPAPEPAREGRGRPKRPAAAECESGTSRCSGDLLMGCVGGRWKQEQDCAASGASCWDMGGQGACGVDGTL